MDSLPEITYSDMTVIQLKSIARERNLRGFSKLRKKELIDLITMNDAGKIEPYVHKCEYTMKARRKGCRGYSKMNKQQLKTFSRNCQTYTPIEELKAKAKIDMMMGKGLYKDVKESRVFKYGLPALGVGAVSLGSLAYYQSIPKHYYL